MYGKKAVVFSVVALLGVSLVAGCGGGGSKGGTPAPTKKVTRKAVSTTPLASVKYGKETAKIYQFTGAALPEMRISHIFAVGKSLYVKTATNKLARIDLQDEKITKMEDICDLKNEIATADDKGVYFRDSKTVKWVGADKKFGEYTDPKGYINVMRVRKSDKAIYFTKNGDGDNVYRAELSPGKLENVKQYNRKDFSDYGIKNNFSDGNNLFIASSYKKDGHFIAVIKSIDAASNKVVRSYDGFVEEAGKKGKGAKMIMNFPSMAITANYVVMHDNGSCNRLRIFDRASGKYIDDITNTDLKVNRIRSITAVPGTNDVLAIGLSNDKKWSVFRIDL